MTPLSLTPISASVLQLVIVLFTFLFSRAALELSCLHDRMFICGILQLPKAIPELEPWLTDCWFAWFILIGGKTEIRSQSSCSPSAGWAFWHVGHFEEPLFGLWGILGSDFWHEAQILFNSRCQSVKLFFTFLSISLVNSDQTYS